MGAARRETGYDDSDYPEDGYVRLSIGAHAEEVYKTLKDDQPVAEHVFRMIIMVNTQNKTIRKRGKLARIVEAGEWDESYGRAVIDNFRRE